MDNSTVARTGVVPTRGLPVEPVGLAALSFAELPDALRTRLEARVERLGYLGAFFGYAAHQPAALAAFIDFTESLKDAVPFRRAEVIALTVARYMGNEYELAQHVRLCTVRRLPSDWIDELATGVVPAGGSTLDGSEAMVARFAEAAVKRRGWVDDPPFAALVAREGAAAAVGILLLIARYVAHATVGNALGLRPPSAT